MDRPWDHCTLVLAPHTGHPLWNLDGAAVPGHVCHSLLQVIIVRRIIVVLILLLLAAVVILVVLAAAVLLLAVAEARGVATVVARRGDVGGGEDIADLVLGGPVARVSSSRHRRQKSRGDGVRLNLDVPVGRRGERLLLLLLLLFLVAHEDVQLRRRRRWRVLVVVVDLVVRLELRHVLLLLGDGVRGANLGVFTLLPAAAEEGLERDILRQGAGCVPQHCKEEIVRKKCL